MEVIRATLSFWIAIEMRWTLLRQRGQGGSTTVIIHFLQVVGGWISKRPVCAIRSPLISWLPYSLYTPWPLSFLVYNVDIVISFISWEPPPDSSFSSKYRGL